MDRCTLCGQTVKPCSDCEEFCGFYRHVRPLSQGGPDCDGADVYGYIESTWITAEEEDLPLEALDHG